MESEVRAVKVWLCGKEDCSSELIELGEHMTCEVCGAQYEPPDYGDRAREITPVD